MKTLSVIIYAAFVLGIVAFAYTLWRQSRQLKQGTTASRTTSSSRGGSQKLTAGAMLKLIPELRDTGAQWPQILKVLNPTGDQKTADLVQAIRGPHMFDPRTALGVIEDGCTATASSAPGIEALTAAVDSMNKVIGFGR